MRKNYDIFISKGFLIGLALLILNDFVLKSLLNNWFTGKLSDFAGLFVFCLFWIAFFPDLKKIICYSIAILFILWKSELSQPFVESWNNHFFKIDRIVDYSDLAAIAILPFAFLYSSAFETVRIHFILRNIIILIAISSCFATSRARYPVYSSLNAPPPGIPSISIIKTYYYPISEEKLILEIERAISEIAKKNNRHLYTNNSGTIKLTGLNYDSIYIELNFDIGALVSVNKTKNGSSVTLRRLYFPNDFPYSELNELENNPKKVKRFNITTLYIEREYLSKFEKEFILKINSYMINQY